MKPSENADFRSYYGSETASMLDVLASVCVASRSTPEFSRSPIWTLLERTAQQVAAMGFELRGAHAGVQFVGFAFGFTMESGRWLRSTQPPLEKYLSATKFAVLPEWRRQRIGRFLTLELPQRRTEPYAILCVRSHVWTREMYERWGWKKASETFSDANISPLDVLLLELQTAG